MKDDASYACDSCDEEIVVPIDFSAGSHQHLRVVDFDTVDAVNICRQEHMTDQIGMTKVAALASELRRIDPEMAVEAFAADFTSFTDAEIDQKFGDTDVFVFATDNFAAQARGNEVALRLKKPAVWIGVYAGVYAGGRAGEIVFWHTLLLCCYRCLCSARYKAFAFQNPTSDSATILDVQFIDSLAAMIVIGLMTMGSDNRYGKLIEQLGERNFLQVKIDPTWAFAGKDVIKNELKIPDGTDAYFSFCTIARRDPDAGGVHCPDCARYLGRSFAGQADDALPAPVASDFGVLRASAFGDPDFNPEDHPLFGLIYPVPFQPKE